MRLSIILLRRGCIVQVWSRMFAQLENTIMIKFLPKSSLHFRRVNTIKVMNLLVPMKMMWQVRLILKTCTKNKLRQ
jgi:hypothetical protein